MALSLVAVTEAAAGGEWDVRVIAEGKSLNGNVYTREALEQGADVFDGVKVYVYELPRSGKDHLPDDIKGQVGNGAGLLRNFVGTVEGVRHEIREGVSGLYGTLKLIAPWARSLFQEAWAAGKRNLFGFSIDALARRNEAGDVVEFAPNPTLDIVDHPAAGGELLRLVASIQKQEPAMSDSTGDTAAVTPEPAPAAVVDVDRVAEAVTAAVQANAEHRMACSDAINDTLTDSGLKTAAVKRLRESLRPQTFETVEAAKEATTAAIDAEREYIVAVSDAPAIVGAGTERHIEAGNDELDTFQTRLDATLMDRPIKTDKGLIAGFSGYREAWHQWTGLVGDKDARGRSMGRNIGLDANAHSVLGTLNGFAGTPYSRQYGALAESMKPGGGFRRAQEAIITTTFGQAWGDSVTRALIANFNLDAFQDWRKVVSKFGSVSDFRTQRRQHLGGFANLSSVSEGGTYTDLTNPADTEETFAPVKYGNTFNISMESILNDDIGVVQALVQSLGRAAVRTLREDVLDLVTTDNPTMGEDAVALYSTARTGTVQDNLTTAALTGAALRDIRISMRDKQAYGNTAETLGNANLPKILIVPNELEAQATAFIDSTVAIMEPDATAAMPADANATVPNQPWIRQLDLLVYDELTNAGDYFLMADPMLAPTVEVDFLNGRQEPEVFVQNEATNGANFTADTVTYKIRHIWARAVLDYRSFHQADV